MNKLIHNSIRESWISLPRNIRRENTARAFVRLGLAFALFFPSISVSYSLDIKDSSSCIIIKGITIQGNKKTKDKIILRELNFSSGDTLKDDIELSLRKARNRIFNTGLFTFVDLSLQNDSLFIAVRERWYTTPIPFGGLADRNFNEWWVTRNRDPERVFYGINFLQKNVRGKNESLRLKLVGGFYKKAELFYTIPYINKKLTTGLTFHTFYQTNKQIAYESEGHKLHYYEDEKYIRNRFFTEVLFSHRKKFYQTHWAGLGYYYSTIGDTIAELNPNYFLNGRTAQKYLSLKYSYANDRRNIVYYPLKGTYFRFDIEKLGIGLIDNIDQLNIRTEYALFLKLREKFYLSGGFTNKISFPSRQPYFNTRGLGYDKDYISGYELYVIDGQDYSLVKTNLKWQLFNFTKSFSKIPLTQFQKIPFAAYLKTYFDAGYVSDDSFNPKNNFLSERVLYGGGLGLDFVSYYDFVVRLEYSLNNRLQHGFFVHLKAGI